MRTKNAFRNSLYNIIYQVLILLVGFFVPKLIISTYGSEVNGLTANINQLINIINLLQAGLIGASIYEMFSPIVSEDYKAIGSIYYSSKRYFKRVSWIFFGLVILIIPYLLFFSKSSLNYIDVILSVLILGINATIIFRYVTSYDVIFSAFQEKYILVIANVIEKVIYYFILFIILFLKIHYLYMYVSVLIGSLIKIIYLEHIYKRKYRDKLQEYKNLTSYKIKNQYKLFGNQLIQNIIESTPTLAVTTIYGLEYASVLSIYLMITNVFKILMSTLQNSILSSFGDLVVRGNKEKIIQVFNILQLIFTCGSIVCFGVTALLITPFVKLYSISNTEISYVFKNLGVCMTFYICAYTQFLSYNLMINSYGMYGKVLKGNIIIGIISLIFMLIFGKFNFELSYIGAIIFYVLCIIHRHITLVNSEIKLSTKNLIRTMVPFIIIGIEFPIASIILNNINNWATWIIYAIIICIFVSIIVLVYIILFERKETKLLFSYLKELKTKKVIAIN